jgi:phosphoglycolate phosphatase-like HAD superfamily hydrolase
LAISLIVFDCDGVILESVNVKTCAFEKIVEQYGPDAAARMTEYHLAHGGVSRFRKFEWFYDEVLGRIITEDELQTLSLEFSQLVFDGVMCAPLVTGIMETLLSLHGRLPMYVASGTPHEELRQVLDARNLTRFFKAVYGAPPGKTELLRYIINREDVSPKNTLMVGDSSTDMDAAEACGACFFGVGSAFSGTSWPYAVDCTAIVKWVNEQRMD